MSIPKSKVDELIGCELANDFIFSKAIVILLCSLMSPPSATTKEHHKKKSFKNNINTIKVICGIDVFDF